MKETRKKCVRRSLLKTFFSSNIVTYWQIFPFSFQLICIYWDTSFFFYLPFSQIINEYGSFLIIYSLTTTSDLYHTWFINKNSKQKMLSIWKVIKDYTKYNLEHTLDVYSLCVHNFQICKIKKTAQHK